MTEPVDSASESLGHSHREATSSQSPAPVSLRAARQRLPSPRGEREETATPGRERLNVASRRSHAKSKTGCRTCKRRKIKCDEHRPSCRNCVRHGVKCDFNQQDAPITASPQTSMIHGGNTYSSADLNMLDLELMYNFTTFTYATLSNEPDVRQMLKTATIRMAMENDYLMRMILAVSALHLAHFRPNKRAICLHRALEHHTASTKKAIPLMSKLERKDCEPVHLFSVFTLYFALGCPREEESIYNEQESVVPHWLSLVRGPEPLLKMMDIENYIGPLSPLFAFGRLRWRRLHSDEIAVDPSILAELPERVSKSCDDPDLLYVYEKAMAHLRNMLSILFPVPQLEPESRTVSNDSDTPMSNSTTSPPLTLDPWDILIFTWQMVDFWGVLQPPKPPQEALAIFAHLLIVFKKVENQWWLEGWATHVMERLWTFLDDEHRLWVQWPIEELGWVPP